MKKSDLINLAFIMLFLVIITLPSLCLIVGFRVGSATFENKEKVSFPAINKSFEDFTKNFEAYYQDQFGLKNLLVISNSALRYFILNSSSADEVLIGNDNSLLFRQKNSLSDFRNKDLFLNKELREWARALQARSDYAKEKGATYLFIVAPDSKSIYPEKLPKWVAPEEHESRLDQLYEYLAEHTNVNFLDLRAPLRAAKESKSIYYKTDSHWNDEGAYIVYLEIIKKLNTLWGKDGIEAISPDKFILKHERVSGDLALMLGLNSIIKEDSIRLIHKTPWNSHIVEEGPAELPSIKTHNPHINSKDLKLVFFHDSFGKTILSWLSESFSTSHYIQADSFNRQSVKDLQPKFVIQMLVERKLYQYQPHKFQ